MDVLYSTDTSYTAPKYFFPLSNYNVDSWPIPQYNFVNGSNTSSWVPDLFFGSVLQCQVGWHQRTLSLNMGPTNGMQMQSAECRSSDGLSTLLA